MKNYLLALFFLFHLAVSAQVVHLKRLNGMELDTTLRVGVLKQYDGGELLYESVKDCSFSVDTSLFKNIVRIEIYPGQGQNYVNEFSRSQIARLDTIVINQTESMFGPAFTPRILVNAHTDLTMMLEDHLWFGTYLEEHPEVVKSLRYEIYSTESLTADQKNKVKAIVKEFSTRIKQPQTSNLLTFKTVPYITTETDAFLKGTAITKQFIDSQNTEKMREMAQKYSLVIKVCITPVGTQEPNALRND